METVTLQTESFLFEKSDGKIRAIPFYELSVGEWVVYEDGQPKYLLDFNRRTKPLILDLFAKLNNGEPLEEVIQKLGRFLGRQWITEHNIHGKEIPNSHQAESATLTLLDNMADIFMDVYFVAVDNINFEILLDEDKFIKHFVTETDEQVFEYAYAENQADLICILTFIFNSTIVLTKLTSNNDRHVFDLTQHTHHCITFEELETKYKLWIKQSHRENSMNQYGIFMNVISFIRNNFDKNHLLAITEERKHW